MTKQRRPRAVRRSRRILIATVLCGSLALGIPLARASLVAIDADETILNGGGFPASQWEPDTGGSNGDISGAYQPVDDGDVYLKDGSQNDDAFDDGLMLADGTGAGFQARTNTGGDSVGNFSVAKFGNQLVTGPDTLGGLRVRRFDAAWRKGPVLRTLVELKNNSGTKTATNLWWGSDFGSDTFTEVRKTSSGDATYNKSDRWVVTSDSATAPDDPPVTQVLFGKHGNGPNATITAPGNLQTESTVQYHVAVKAHQTAYLLLFSEMNLSNGAAINRAKKYNRVRSGSPLLAGLGNKVKKHILNWNF